MSQLEFDEILRRYLAGRASSDEEKLILQWYESFINESQIDISVQEKKAIEAKIWKKLKDKIGRNGETARHARKPVIFRTWFKYAAACLLLIIAVKAFLVYRLSYKTEVPAKAFTHIQIPPQYRSIFNSSKADMDITLADGSMVKLQPQGGLYYPEKFTGTTRNVYLTGNAFFKITHQAAHHFFVHTNEGLLTEVLGTSFYIFHSDKGSSKEGRIAVNVVSGKVYVYREEGTTTAKKYPSKKILLTPNQRVEFSPKNNQFVVSLVDDPKPIQSDEEYIAPPPAAFTYADAPLSDILNDVASTYGISIKLDNPKLNNCHFTGDITKQSLYDKLDIICEATQSSYEVKGTVIYIKGEGCN